MASDCTTDEELMQRVAGCNHPAMDILVRRYATGLLTFLHRMTGDRHRAEELFQEAFLAVWVDRRRYEYPRAFRPWLFGIAANKCHTELRRRPGPPAFLVDSSDAPAANDSTPIEAAIASENATLVAQAMTMLPPKQRAVLALRIWDGLEYEQIAQLLDRTEATIRSQMFHALGAMRRYLEPRLRQVEAK
jgi:RNA polymerase sigma-70 factor (ECF subfamily)